MDNTTVDSMCRCCAAEGIFKDIKTSYLWMGEEEVYGDMLRECFDVKLVTIEEGGICEVCITQLRNAVNFKKQVVHTEKKFKRHLESRRFKPTEVKEEVSGDNGNSSDDNDNGGADSEDDEDYVPDFEIPIKTESPEEAKSRKRSAKATTSRAKKSRSSDVAEKSVDIRDHKAIKSEIENSWGVTIVKVKGPKADGNQTRVDDKEPKTSQSNKRQSKKRDSKNSDNNMISLKKEMLKRTAGKRFNIEQVTIECDKALEDPSTVDDSKPDESKLSKSITVQKKAHKTNETTGQRIKINPPPDLNFMKAINTSSTKINENSSVVVAKSKTPQPRKTPTIKKEPPKPNEAVQRMKIIPPPDMDFMMELDKHRFNIRTVMQYSNATPIRNHVKSGFVCCFCDAHFPKPADLKVHTIQTHTDNESKDKFFRKKAVLYSFMVKLDITALICNICHMTVDTLEQLIEHLNTTHQKGLHTDIKSHIVCFKFESEVMRCLMCMLEFNSFKLLSEHMNQHYTNFVCDECGAGFINRRQLLLHSDKHKVGAHKCGSCDKVFQSLKRMKTHERVTHVYNSGLGTHGFRCHHCNEKFKSKKAKNDHMAQAHGVI